MNMKKKVTSLVLALCLVVCTVLATNMQVQAATPTGSDVVTTAKTLIGKSYKSGGNGPDSFDASGMVVYTYKKATGIDLSKKIGRTCQLLYNGTIKNKLTITKASLAKGDVVFYGTSTKKITNAAIYIGSGKVICVSSKGVKKLATNSAAGAGTKVIGYASAAKIIKKYKTTETKPAPIVDDSKKIGTTVAAYVTGLVGKSYKSGGNGPESFDASGLIVYTYKNAVAVDFSSTKKLGRTCQSMCTNVINKKLTTTKANLAKGDIVFYGASTKKVTNAAIYVGSNKVVYVNGKGVKKAAISSAAASGTKVVAYGSAAKIIAAYK